MGYGNFDPPQNSHPFTHHQTVGTGDYVGDPYGCAVFDAIPPMGGISANE